MLWLSVPVFYPSYSVCKCFSFSNCLKHFCASRPNYCRGIRKEQISVDILHKYNTKVIVTLIPRRSNSVAQRLVMCLHQVTVKPTSVRMVASYITFHTEWLLQELDNRIRASLPFLVTPTRTISIVLYSICHRSEVSMISAGLKVPFMLLLLTFEISESALVVLTFRDMIKCSRHNSL